MRLMIEESALVFLCPFSSMSRIQIGRSSPDCNTYATCVPIHINLTRVYGFKFVYIDLCPAYEFMRSETTQNTYLALDSLLLFIFEGAAKSNHEHKVNISRNRLSAFCNSSCSSLIAYSSLSFSWHKYKDTGSNVQGNPSFPLWSTFSRVSHKHLESWQLDILLFPPAYDLIQLLLVSGLLLATKILSDLLRLR